MPITTSTLREQLLHKINTKTKPPGALGQLETIALQVGLIRQTTEPVIMQPHILVFAGDHGIAATGLVNPYPQAVTAQMVLNFLHGGAAINVFCRQHGIGLKVVDAGVNHDFEAGKGPVELIDAKIGYGTRNYLEEPAMSVGQCKAALADGHRIVQEIHAGGCNCIGFGEMGIGNTSSAALLMSAITGIPVEDCTGRGTGANDEQLLQKTETLREVFRKHLPAIANQPTPENILQHFGGFEIAMMTGAFLEAARQKMVIVVDGFIATAALLVAQAMEKEVLSHCIFAHTSGERGHQKMLEYLQATPLLQLGLRLGEGTGAALAIPLIQSAVCFLNEMASFESAGVSEAG